MRLQVRGNKTMIVTTNKTNKEDTVEQNPYEAFATLLAELEAEGFFTQIDTASPGNNRYQPLLQCHLIN